MPSIKEWIAGETVSGALLPIEHVNEYRKRRGLEPLIREWDIRNSSDAVFGIPEKREGESKPCPDCFNARSQFAKKVIPNKTKRNPFTYDRGYLPEVVTLEQRSRDIKQLVSKLPYDTRLVVGIARSGISVANDIAMLMNIPVQIANYHTREPVEVGNGWRLNHAKPQSGGVLLVDDTSMTGNSFHHTEASIRKFYPELKTCVLYRNPLANFEVDFFGRELKWPHYLEWNMYNSVNVESMAFDFDGVFCQDCPPGCDDDGPRYLDFIRNAHFRFPCRRAEIRLIVTARLEKYREETMKWLESRGMRVRKLVMGPWKNLEERRRVDIGSWKAGHAARFFRTNTGIRPNTFVESDDHQARVIASQCPVDSGVVLCVDSAKCYLPSA